MNAPIVYGALADNAFAGASLPNPLPPTEPAVLTSTLHRQAIGWSVLQAEVSACRVGSRPYPGGQDATLDGAALDMAPGLSKATRAFGTDRVLFSLNDPGGG